MELPRPWPVCCVWVDAERNGVVECRPSGDHRGPRPEDRGQRTEARDIGERPEDGGHRTEARGQRPEDRGQRTETRA